MVEERGAGEQADKYFSLDAKKYFPSAKRDIFSIQTKELYFAAPRMAGEVADTEARYCRYLANRQTLFIIISFRHCGEN